MKYLFALIFIGLAVNAYAATAPCSDPTKPACATPVYLSSGPNGTQIGTVGNPLVVSGGTTGGGGGGAVTQGTSPWVDNITQLGGNAIATGAGASNTGTVRSVLSSDSTVGLSGTLPAFGATPTFNLGNSIPAGPNAIGSVSVSNFPATQPISATSLPLPAGAATSANQSSQLTAEQTTATNTTNLAPGPTGNAIKNFGVTTTTSAVQLSSNTYTAGFLVCKVGGTGVDFIGGSSSVAASYGVTASGYPLTTIGQCWPSNGNNSNLAWVISSSAGDTLEVTGN